MLDLHMGLLVVITVKKKKLRNGRSWTELKGKGNRFKQQIYRKL